MSKSSTWHRISDADPETMRGTCSQCGPGARVYFERYGGNWRCAARHNQSRNATSKRPHGMTTDEAREYLKDKSCRICGTTENLVVDHCHDSLRIRGPLCSNHNKGLGFFFDNVDHLLAAVEYLRVDSERGEE